MRAHNEKPPALCAGGFDLSRKIAFMSDSAPAGEIDIVCAAFYGRKAEVVIGIEIE